MLLLNKQRSRAVLCLIAADPYAPLLTRIILQYRRIGLSQLLPHLMIFNDSGVLVSHEGPKAILEALAH